MQGDVSVDVNFCMIKKIGMFAEATPHFGYPNFDNEEQEKTWKLLIRNGKSSEIINRALETLARNPEVAADALKAHREHVVRSISGIANLNSISPELLQQLSHIDLQILKEIVHICQYARNGGIDGFTLQEAETIINTAIVQDVMEAKSDLLSDLSDEVEYIPAGGV